MHLAKLEVVGSLPWTNANGETRLDWFELCWFHILYVIRNLYIIFEIFFKYLFIFFINSIIYMYMVIQCNCEYSSGQIHPVYASFL